jgi:tetratricopeptide (TPR) repeat protein/tRNA A-37 threonylcarbamoyl transferase component Bud32
VPADPSSTEETFAAPELEGVAISDAATIFGEGVAASSAVGRRSEDGTAPRSPTKPVADSDVVAPRIGRFSVLRKLGEGGMGIVYAGYDDELDRKVAIKLLRGKANVNLDGRRSRMLREAQALARLSHPNVVQVYEIGEHEQGSFIAMEYVDGPTIKDWITQPRTRAEILSVFIAAGRGLAAAHQKGLVHRDFKPDNVMITHDGRVLVMDFGLVHEANSEVEAKARVTKMLDSADVLISQSLRVSALSTDLTATGAMMGTPAYMSPEQFIGRPTDARTDQFSFCVALWEALCGERPFEGDTFATLCFSVTQAKLREPPRGKLPGYLRKIIERGLAGDIEQRWPSMEPLLAELGKNRTRRRRVAAGVIVPLLVVLGVGKGWQLEREAERARAIAGCEAEGESITETWDPEPGSDLAAVFHATGLGFADDAWARTEVALDRYALDWQAMRTEVCLATRVEGTLPEADLVLRTECLDERRAGLHSLIELLGKADAELVNHAVQAAVGLPLLSTCNDERSLAQRVRPPEETGAEITELRARLEGVEILLAGARYQAARDEAEAVLERAQAIAWPAIEAEARYALGLAEIKLAHYESAATEIERAFFLAGDAGHDRLALRAASSLLEVVGDELEQHAMGHHWGELAAMFIDRLGLTGSVDEAQLANSLGNSLSAQSKLDEALAAYQRARDLWTAALGPEHPSVGTALNNIGIVQRKQGNYSDALVSMNEALRIREATLGPSHPRVADARYNIGNVLRQLGRDDEALALFEQALATWQAGLGPRHRNVAFGLSNIGNVHFGRGELDQALALYEQANEIWIETLGAEHTDVAMGLNNIGNVYYTRGDLEQALVTYQRAVAIWEAALGPDHPSVAMGLGNLAQVLQARGEPEQAVALHERVLAIQIATHGPEHPDVAHTLANLGGAQQSRGDLSAARKSFDRALEILERSEIDPVERARTEFGAAGVMWEQGEREAARTLALTARERCVAADSKQSIEAIDAWLATHGGAATLGAKPR